MDSDQGLVKRVSQRVLGAVDGAVVRQVLTPKAPAREPIEALAHPERMRVMRAFATFYEQLATRDGGRGFFTRGDSPRVHQRRRRRYGGDGEVIDLSFEGGFRQLWSPSAAAEVLDAAIEDMRQRAGAEAADGLADALRACQRADQELALETRYDCVEENRSMHARWFHHRGAPRPCAVVLHGYLGGHLPLEERVWPVRRLFDRGFDVVLAVLPMHGQRAPGGRRLRLPAFPSSDPRLAIEGFRHLVHDHLTLFDYLLAGRCTSLGVLGMSLGGYSAALLSTLDPRLRFGVFFMPLCSIADFALRSGRMVGSAEQQATQAAALERTYRVISPVARPSQLPNGSALVIAGQADRITGLQHGERLTTHFDATPRTFGGSHLVPLGRDAAFAPMWPLLDRVRDNEVPRGSAASAASAASAEPGSGPGPGDRSSTTRARSA